MALMLGKEYCKLDSNGRFKLPVTLKKQIPTDDPRFVILPSLNNDRLELWMYASFGAKMTALRKRLREYSSVEAKLFRKMNEGHIVELDSNDRIVIPSEFKKPLNSSKDLVLLGLGNRIEIWDSKAYDNYMNDGTDFVSAASELLQDFYQEDF